MLAKAAENWGFQLQQITTEMAYHGMATTSQFLRCYFRSKPQWMVDINNLEKCYSVFQAFENSVTT